MAFAEDPFGFGIQVDLTPAPELQGGFSVGVVFVFGMLCSVVLRWCELGWGVFVWYVLDFGFGFGVFPGVCVMVSGLCFSCMHPYVFVWFEFSLLLPV